VLAQFSQADHSSSSPLQFFVSRYAGWISYRTWALDVADNASRGIIHELDSDLGNSSTRSCTVSVPLHPMSPRFPNIPVRPRTLVTLTSLTGTFEDSMIAIYSFVALAPSSFWVAEQDLQRESYFYQWCIRTR
jgi:hypothetical protein